MLVVLKVVVTAIAAGAKTAAVDDDFAATVVEGAHNAISHDVILITGKWHESAQSLQSLHSSYLSILQNDGTVVERSDKPSAEDIKLFFHIQLSRTRNLSCS